jgi:hypothetical protein
LPLTESGLGQQAEQMFGAIDYRLSANFGKRALLWIETNGGQTVGNEMWRHSERHPWQSRSEILPVQNPTTGNSKLLEKVEEGKYFVNFCG